MCPASITPSLAHRRWAPHTNTSPGFPSSFRGSDQEKDIFSAFLHLKELVQSQELLTDQEHDGNSGEKQQQTPPDPSVSVLWTSSVFSWKGVFLPGLEPNSCRPCSAVLTWLWDQTRYWWKHWRRRLSFSSAINTFQLQMFLYHMMSLTCMKCRSSGFKVNIYND